MQKYNSRQEVPDKYKWDLTTLYPNVEAYDKDYDLMLKLYNIK